MVNPLVKQAIVYNQKAKFGGYYMVLPHVQT